MKYSLVLAAAAGFGQVSATFGFGGKKFFNAKPFECPKNIDNICKPQHTGGIGYGDAPTGPVTNYDGFKYGGGSWSCKQGNQGRDIMGRTIFGSKFLSADCGDDVAPTIEVDDNNDGPKYFSMTKFDINCEKEGDMEMEFEMPDGRKCRTPPKSCGKGKNTLENNQCGGAKKVKFHYKPKKGGKCKIDWHHIDLDCNNNCKPGMPGCPPCTPGQPGCPPETCTPGQPGCPPETCPPGKPGCPPETCTPGQPGCPPETCTPGKPGCPPETCTPGQPGCPPSECKYGEPGCAVTPPPVNPGESNTPSNPLPTPPPVNPGESNTPSSPVSTPPVNPGESNTPSNPVSTPPVNSGESNTSSNPGSTAPPASSGESNTSSNPVPTPPPVNPGESNTSSNPVPTPPPVNPGESNTYSNPKPTPPPQTPEEPEEPVGGPDCPPVVPSCLNTWIPVLGECKNSLDAKCYCKHADLINSVYECIYANGESDDGIAEAVQALRGICAPQIPENPAIVTGGDSITSYITVTGTPMIPSAVYTTIVVDATVTVPCVTGGTTIPGSSTVTVIKTEVPVPQVTMPAPPKETSGQQQPEVPVEKPQVPVGEQPQVPQPSGVVPPPAVTPPPAAAQPTPPPVTAGAANVRAGFGMGLAVMAVVAAL